MNDEKRMLTAGKGNQLNEGVSVTGSHTILKQLGNIVEYMNHGSNIVPLTDIVVAPRNYDYLVDTDIVRAKLYKEGTDIPDEAIVNLASISMPQSRMATVTTVSLKVIGGALANEDEHLLDNHIYSQLYKRFAPEMEFQMFNSPAAIAQSNSTTGGTVNFGSIFKYNNSNPTEKIVERGTTSTSLSFAHLMEAYNEFVLKQSDNLNGAIWVFNKITIGFLGKVKDGNGNYVLTGWDKDLPEGAVGRLFGIPVYVTPTFNDNPNASTEMAVLMNPKKAYAFTVSKDIEIQKITGDTIQATRSSALYKAEIGVCGNVVNPRAIVICKANYVAPA